MSNRYAASFTIIDDHGEVAYERELTQDEIIAELLEHRPLEIVGVPIQAPEPVPARSRVTAAKGGKPKNRICGSCGEGGHNARTCPNNDSAPKVETEVGEGEPITEEQFDEVKFDKEMGKPSLVIASRLKIPLLEVNRAFSAPDYDWYVEHR